ncbi:hypothetical protein WA026_003005 [Henosepilachna vigintioctopunctata]|uniref:Uncharacterized protein n=1 Tax=Henosepilachna vigintioctopunctata TaxID=420089 RepID=A0AAW1TND3_9CUCU
MWVNSEKTPPRSAATIWPVVDRRTVTLHFYLLRPFDRPRPPTFAERDAHQRRISLKGLKYLGLDNSMAMTKTLSLFVLDIFSNNFFSDCATFARLRKIVEPGTLLGALLAHDHIYFVINWTILGLTLRIKKVMCNQFRQNPDTPSLIRYNALDLAKTDTILLVEFENPTLLTGAHHAMKVFSHLYPPSLIQYKSYGDRHL